MSIEVGDLVEGEIESLAFGGDGILRTNGLVVFVPMVAVGDKISAKVTTVKRSHAFAEIEALSSPGNGRTEPLCQYYGTCGGCQLQHLDGGAQTAYKRQAVEDALKRIGRIEVAGGVEMVEAPSEWGYRRRIKLTMAADGGFGYLLGYVRRDLEGIVRVQECGIFLEDDHSLFEELSTLCSKLEAVPGDPAQLSVFKVDNNKFAFHFLFPDESPGDLEYHLRKAVEQYDHWNGALITDVNGAKTIGDITGTFDVDGLAIGFDVRCFVQAHPQQSARIYQDVAALVAQRAPERVLDLYSGIGITSLLFARDGATVLGVEGNEHSVGMAQANAARNDIDDASFVAADVSRVADKLVGSHAPELIFVNPPRTGLSERVTATLAKAPSRTLVYVSCMPSTLARDLVKLEKGGWNVSSVTAYDMFPQTAHVETVVVLDR